MRDDLEFVSAEEWRAAGERAFRMRRPVNAAAGDAAAGDAAAGDTETVDSETDGIVTSDVPVEDVAVGDPMPGGDSTSVGAPVSDGSVSDGSVPGDPAPGGAPAGDPVLGNTSVGGMADRGMADRGMADGGMDASGVVVDESNIAGAFCTVDGREVSFDGLVRDTVSRLAMLQAQRAALDAESARVLAHARNQAVEETLGRNDGGATTERAIRQLASEIGIATRRHDRSVTAQLERATKLVDQTPSLRAALAEGSVDLQRAEACLPPLLSLATDEQRTEYDQRVVELAQRLAPKPLAREANALAQEIAQAEVQERCKAAIATRTSWVTELDDGMAEYHLIASSALVRAIHERTGQLAHLQMQLDREAREQLLRERADEVKQQGEASGASAASVASSASDASDGELGMAKLPELPELRTFAQVRADIATELLLCSDPAQVAVAGQGIRAHVQLTVPALALAPNAAALAKGAAALAQNAAALVKAGEAGEAAAARPLDPETAALLSAIAANAAASPRDAAGPIDMDTARQIAGDAVELTRILTDPITDQVVGIDSRLPNEPMRRFLRARDATCRYPGCLRAAANCEVDHTIAWSDGGGTELTNLAHLCIWHHTLKHYPGYSVTQSPDGTLTWRTPTGQVINDVPSTAHLPGTQRPVVFRPSDAGDVAEARSATGSQSDSDPPPF